MLKETMMTNHLKVLSLALGALCTLAPACASEPSAMVVVRDALTGQMRAPTAAELQALNAQRTSSPVLNPQTSVAGTLHPVVTTSANGTLRATVSKESLQYAVIRRDADGKLQSQCVSGKQAATNALSLAVPTIANAEEHQHENQ
jgi:hypothetical protein